MHTGVPQCSMLSPTLYILYLQNPKHIDYLALLCADNCMHLDRHGFVWCDELDTISTWEHLLSITYTFKGRLGKENLTVALLI